MIDSPTKELSIFALDSRLTDFPDHNIFNMDANDISLYTIIKFLSNIFDITWVIDLQ